MVKRLIFMFLLACVFLTNAVKAEELLLIIEKSRVEFGQFSKAELYGINLDRKLSDIDLHELEENFGVVIDETVEQVDDDRWPGKIVQLIELRLYPRQTGKIDIPALQFAKSRSDPQSLMVVPEIGEIEIADSNMNINIKMSSSRPWQRELVTALVEINTTESFVTLQADALVLEGFDVFPIAPKSEKIVSNGTTYYKLSIGWALFPLLEGDYNIELPAIEFRQFSQTIRSYFLPKQALTVRRLPAYIPPTMPVGKIILLSDLTSDKILYPNRLSSFNIRVKGEGVSPRWVPSLRSQLSSSSQLTFYTIKTERTSTASRDSVRTTVTHHIPFKAVHSGRTQLATLQTQYFDPVSAKIVNVEHRTLPVYVLALAWRVLFFVFALLLLATAIRKIYLQSIRWYTRRALRLAAYIELQSANTPSEIRKALNEVSVSEGWSSNLTLTAWLDRWQSNFTNNEQMKLQLLRLSEACYGKTTSIESSNIRDDLLTLIRKK